MRLQNAYRCRTKLEVHVMRYTYMLQRSFFWSEKAFLNIVECILRSRNLC